MPAAPQKRRAERAGRWAEWAAALFLMLKGYRIVARRHRTAAGELDLVAVRGRSLVFVEVKYRAQRDAAPFALGPRQRDRLRRAAALYLAGQPRWSGRDPRFDVVLVQPRGLPQHIKNAW